uniref:Uncharacterized protein n=1 Tax=Corethron hystrix TaxID=216773 RepID=A0A7S1C204_9STRA|mmetsp:Transcript_8121/g.17641  ORF Transcript_8121/g.17641 Transcript_8121/m.17641 type:complete len:198 (+) Transcript_8121:294-887(+)
MKKDNEHVTKEIRKNTELSALEQHLDHRLFNDFEIFSRKGTTLWNFFRRSLTDDYFKRKWKNDVNAPQRKKIREQLKFASRIFRHYKIAKKNKKFFAKYTGCWTLATVCSGFLLFPTTVGVIAVSETIRYKSIKDKEKHKRNIVNFCQQIQDDYDGDSVVRMWVFSFIRVFAEGASVSISEQLDTLCPKNLADAEFV